MDNAQLKMRDWRFYLVKKKRERENEKARVL